MFEKYGIRSEDDRIFFRYKGDVADRNPATFSDQHTIRLALMLTMLSTKRMTNEE